MKYHGAQPVQEHKRQKQIDLNLNVENAQRVNGSRVRPFSSSSSKSNTTQRSVLSASSSSQRPGTGLTVHDASETRAKKNVFFSREPIRISNGGDEQENVNIDLTKLNIPVHNSRDLHSPSRAGILSPRGTNSHSTLTSTQNENISRRKPPGQLRRSTSATASLSSTNGSRSSAEVKRRPRSRGRLSSKESSMQSDDTKSPPRTARRSKRNGVTPRQRSNSCDSSETEIESPRSTTIYSPVSQNLNSETLAALEAISEAQKQAWEQFETHIKLIDDSTEFISRMPKKTFNSSEVFQSVMSDMFGNTEYGKTRGFTKLKSHVGHIATFASRFIGKVKALHQTQDAGDFDDEDYFDGEEHYEPSKETIENARRGWRILRQHVQEMAAEKRMSQSTLSWDMLRHTVRGLTNMERTRYDLYQRYGIVPMVRSDGTVVQENTMLSERARSALANKPKNPVMTRYHSATFKRPSVYKSIDGFHGFNRSETP